MEKSTGLIEDIHSSVSRDDSEKGSSPIGHVEHAVDASGQPVYDDAEVRRIRRKIDWRLLPMLTFLYLASFVDRSNIGNAAIAGMNKDLALTGGQYNLALTLFFIPYVIFEVPANIVLKHMRPSWWIGIITTAWGLVVTFQGFVTNHEELYAVRFILGIAEAGFFPAAAFLLTIWYCRFEIQTRFGIFYLATSSAGAFSGLLAYGLQFMNGLGGKAGWRWIFIIEGIITTIAGIAVPFVLPDSPDKVNWLTPAEKELHRTRLAQDSGTAAGKVAVQEKFHWGALKDAMLDWKIWFAILIFWGTTVPTYAFAFTAPKIVADLGYTAANAQLLVVPIYVFAAITTLVATRMSDRYRIRWPFIVFPYCFATVGFIGLLAIPHPKLPGLTYAFLFFIPGGCYPGVITMVGWLGANLAPTSKRAIGIALGISLANAGGLVGSNIYLEQEAPRYWLGYGFSLACVVTGIFATLALRFFYKSANDKRDRMTEEEIRAKYTEEELLLLGDKSPLYRYVL